jgi:two-component sensor histidine kinase
MNKIYPSPGDTPPREIFITDELAKRPPRRTNYRQETLALQDLGSRLIGTPEDVLPRFVQLAMELTGGISAGFSLYEPDPAPGIFRWRYLHGSLSAFENATTPRNYSPCGITLDQNRPVLTRHSERFYTWISDANIEVPEVLLVPLTVGGKDPMGTLWIVSDEDGHFDSGDVRVASELAAFAGIALHIMRSRKKLEQALEEQETLTREMGHRIKNLFSVAEGMVRMTARSSATKEEMVATLIGRFHSLANAHGLVRRGFAQQETRLTDLTALVAAIVQPHERADGGIPRFAIDGPAIQCSENSINGVAMMFHELTTNAAKYGALKEDEGKVSIRWQKEGDHIDFHWLERGGPRIAAAPQASGFGSKLLHDMVARQFNGTFQHQWNPEGLEVRISLPVASLTNQ